MTARLELHAVTKRYGKLVANDGIDLRVAPGQIHAVLGENGAGKSTLMKIICGIVAPDAGRVLWNGRQVRIANPAQARALGIAMVFQHFALFDSLTVAENIALGLPSGTRRDELARRIEATAAEYGLELAPGRPVHTLSVGECQRVEIVRALLAKPQLLILDEPTSVLGPEAVDKLFATLRQLAAGGCSILYISHKLDEIGALCHHCTVIRDGKNVGSCDPRTESAASLSHMMIGAPPPPLSHTIQMADPAPGARRLVVRNLCLPKSHPFGVDLADISFELRAGEIVGLAGVSGNGQQELLATLSGEDRRADGAAIMLGDTAAGRLGPAARRALGLGFVPEERLGRGAVSELSLADNVLLTQQGSEAVRYGLVQTRALAARARAVIERFKVKAGGPQAPAGSLSGGNLQKYIMGREIMRAPRVLLVAQPTWGVDVGAAAQIRAELLALRDAGCALLLVSEELDELFALADRLHVIARGRLSPSIATADAGVAQIGQWMSGLWPQAGGARHAAA
ncbi:MAG: ABC transporter ATP-binding protein [Pseudomonadota bacterium]